MDFKAAEFEVFLPHHTPSKHRVMAMVQEPHEQLHAVATVDTPLSARRTADALNSRLLARHNHEARLDAALVGLPDSVRATIQQLPIHPDKATIGRAPLASHLYGDPIDGIMLFPTKRCEPGRCTICADCEKDCQDCQICTEGSCDGCHTPDLTPRTAQVLNAALSVCADLCYDDAESLDSHDDLDGELAVLPRVMARQNAKFIRRMARAFDDLRYDLIAGEYARPLCMAEQIALDLAIQYADAMNQDEPELIEEHTLGLPESRFDYEFDGLYDVLFEDTDHIGYLSSDHEPERPGYLEDLFDPFYEGEDHRDPDRGFRR